MLSSDSTRLTGAHQFIGTFNYASPEQILGGDDGCAVGSVQPRGRGLRAADGAAAVRGDGPGAARERAADEDVPAAVRAASRTCRSGSTWSSGRALAKSAGGSLRVDGAIRGARCSRAAAPNRSTVVIERRPRAAGGGLLATYELGERLGPGRLGSEVFSGTHRALGPPGRHPPAAPRRATATGTPSARRFLREAQTLQVAHPSIIQVRDYGEEGDLVYLVTDFIDGPSLRDVLKTDGAHAVAAAEAAAGAAASRRRACCTARAGCCAGSAPRSCASYRRRGRGRAPDDLDRRHLAGAGSAGDAGGRDAARQRAGRRRAALRRARAADRAERRRAVRRLHDGRGRLRDGDGGAAVRRRVDARAARRDAEGARRAIRGSASRRCPTAAAARDPEGALLRRQKIAT